MMKMGSDSIVMDCGGGTIKVELSSANEPKIMPNAVMKTKNVRGKSFIGDQLDTCNNLSNLFYSYGFQKGYLVNWETQKQVWDHIFSSSIKADLTNSNVIMTEPYYNFVSVKETMNELFFEEYQVKGLFRATPAFFVQYKHRRELKQTLSHCLVIDSGFSFTHIVPICDDKVISAGIKRINVGGKILSNHLKDVISYRQLNVMHETHIINQCKEDVCYVASDFWKDMQTAKLRGKANTVVREYVLPDFVNRRRGFVRGGPGAPEASAAAGTGGSGEEYVVRMNNERFTVPELLFHPSDVGILEKGIGEGVAYTIDSLPEELPRLQTDFWDNIVLSGGNAELPGIRERLYNDVRADAPDDFTVNVHLPKSPRNAAWYGAKSLVASPWDLQQYLVTKAEYEEHGHNICHRRFNDC